MNKITEEINIPFMFDGSQSLSTKLSHSVKNLKNKKIIIISSGIYGLYQNNTPYNRFFNL